MNQNCFFIALLVGRILIGLSGVPAQRGPSAASAEPAVHEHISGFPSPPARGQACPCGSRAGDPVPTGGFQKPDPTHYPDLFVWTDTCNVYVVRDGEAALLIDLGDGSVVGSLHEIGVKQIEWVLLTHHHREQCQGLQRLKGSSTQLAAPEAERALFEKPTDFRKMKVRLGDAFTIHGSSYVRPPIQPVPLARTFGTMDTFMWRGHEFWCLDTRGNSPGAMSYLLRWNDRWLAFSGDLMLNDAKMHNWFDSEWDYGFAAGIYAMCNSAALVASFEPLWLLPSHGPPIRQPCQQLDEFQAKLRHLERLLVRGYEVNTFAAATQNTVSQPTSVPHLWQVSPHLFKFKGPNFWPNFNLILADSGHALVVDCGLLDEEFLDKSLELMRQRLARHTPGGLGLRQIDAVVITHMHGDHLLQAPHLRDRWGAQIWALDLMAAVCEHPERFDYAAPIQAYGSGIDGVRLDRLFKSGETFEWEGYKLTVDWMPGQTQFGLCLHGQIDGRKVAFTGDNIFAPAPVFRQEDAGADDPKQTGHEAVVAHNSAILEEGYIYAGQYLHRLKPDMLVGGHSFVMDHPGKLIERYRKWAYQMRDAFQSLSPDPDYRYWFDPFWVRAEPYRVTLRQDESADVAVHVRNFRRRVQCYRIQIHAPAGLLAEPPILTGALPAGANQAFSVHLRSGPESKAGVNIVALDVTLDGQRYGQWFDFIVEVQR